MKYYIPNMKRWDDHQLAHTLARASSVVKLVCGVANNAAYYVMMDAHDKVKTLPAYRNGVKKAFKDTIKAWKAYEANLVNPVEERFFHMEDMNESTRKRFGDITDREYYDFWAASGGETYQRTQPMITSLANKFRLSLINHNMPNADIIQWPMVANACLQLACRMYDHALDEASKGYELPIDMLRHVFRAFSLHKIAVMWDNALSLIAPGIDDYDLDSTESRNIQFGLRQLQESWFDPDTIYGSVLSAVDEYEEVFRTKGERKKAARELSEIHQEVMEAL